MSRAALIFAWLPMLFITIGNALTAWHRYQPYETNQIQIELFTAWSETEKALRIQEMPAVEPARKGEWFTVKSITVREERSKLCIFKCTTLYVTVSLAEESRPVEIVIKDLSRNGLQNLMEVTPLNIGFPIRSVVPVTVYPDE